MLKLLFNLFWLKNNNSGFLPGFPGWVSTLYCRLDWHLIVTEIITYIQFLLTFYLALYTTAAATWQMVYFDCSDHNESKQVYNRFQHTDPKCLWEIWKKICFYWKTNSGTIGIRYMQTACSKFVTKVILTLYFHCCHERHLKVLWKIILNIMHLQTFFTITQFNKLNLIIIVLLTFNSNKALFTGIKVKLEAYFEPCQT